MKFIYPAVFRKTDKGTYKGFSRILRIVSERARLWMKQLRRQMPLLTTGSLWNLMRMTASSRLFLMQTTWNLKKAISSGIFL